MVCCSQEDISVLVIVFVHEQIEAVVGMNGS
jgi:hypothetical protein